MRLGIAGVGAIAESYMTLIAEGRIAGELTALCSRNADNMRAALERCGIFGVRLFTDYREMLESGEIDAVLICTPHFLHPGMAVEAIERGVHPLIEKPLGVFGDEAAAMLETFARHSEITGGVLYCRRMNPTFRRIRELVDQGAVGNLKRAVWQVTNLYRTDAYHRSSPWRGTWRGEGGGVLMTQASHQLDLFLWLCPPVERVHGFCYEGMQRKISVENDATLHLEFTGGATGQFIASSREFPGVNRLELSGDRGQLIVEDDRHVTWTALEIDEPEFSRTTEGLFGPVPSSRRSFGFDAGDNAAQQAAIINDFIEAVQSGGTPACTPGEAMKSLEVINAAYLSSWRRQGISLPLDHAAFRTELERRMVQ